MKTLQIILLIYAAVVFHQYIFYIIRRYGVLKTISHSYYKLREDNKPLRASWFTFFIWSVGFPLIIVGSSPLMFFAGAFICFVGAAPAFKDMDMENKVHYVGATGGIILGFLSMWIDHHRYGLCLLMVVGAICLTKKMKEKAGWWVEILAFETILVGLALNIGNVYYDWSPLISWIKNII